MVADAVDSLLGQTLPRHDYEIILVDNASTDNTAEVLAAYGASGRILVEREPSLGLSYARNRGLAAARAPCVAFLDDDAVAEPDWLGALLRAFEALPSIGCVGGLVLPRWEIPRPPWLHDALLPCLSVLDWGTEPCILSRPRFIAGANMAFRRGALEQAGGFDPGLGRMGEDLLSGEEQDAVERVESLGWVTRYEPAAKIRHWVPRERLMPEWLLARAAAQGRTDAARLRKAAGGRRGVLRYRAFGTLLSPRFARDLAGSWLARRADRRFLGRFLVTERMALIRALLGSDRTLANG